MADQDDVIRIDLESDVSEGEKAKQKLQELAKQVDDLKASFQAGNVGLSAYKAELASLGREAGKAQKALDAFNESQVKSGAVKLQGADRAAAKAQLGLAAANILQDAIQGGPASTINNFLGLAGNTKIRALTGEYLALAGGVAGVTAALGTFAAVAGSAFLLVDTGLKNAKLEWSDLGEVAANTAPFKAVSETIEGIGVVLKEAGITDALDSAYDAAGSLVGSIADATLGWGDATAAARAHKEQVEGQVKAAREYAETVKAIAKIQSEAQQEQAKRGKLFGQELADLGGKDGLPGLIDRLARFETAKTGDEMTTVPKLDDKGQPTAEKEEITRRELARRRLTIDAGRAARGDEDAINRLRAQAAAAGIDASGLDAAASGIDRKAAGKAEDREAGQLMQERIREAERHVDEVSREYQKRVGDIAKPLQDRFNASTASGNRIDEGATRGKLRALGYSEADASKFAGPVLESLRRGFEADVRERASQKGMTFEEATQDLAAEFGRKEKEARRAAGDKAARDRDRDFDEATAGTGIKERAARGMVQDTVAGRTLDQTRQAAIDRAAAEAQLGGQGADDARQAATAFIDGLLNSMGDRAVHEQFAGQGGDKGLSHFGAADFTNQVESSGIEALQKQANELLKSISDRQAEMLRRPNVAVMGP